MDLLEVNKCMSQVFQSKAIEEAYNIQEKYAQTISQQYFSAQLYGYVGVDNIYYLITQSTKLGFPGDDFRNLLFGG